MTRLMLKLPRSLTCSKVTQLGKVRKFSAGPASSSAAKKNTRQRFTSAS